MKEKTKQNKVYEGVMIAFAVIFAIVYFALSSFNLSILDIYIRNYGFNTVTWILALDITAPLSITILMIYTLLIKFKLVGANKE